MRKNKGRVDLSWWKETIDHRINDIGVGLIGEEEAERVWDGLEVRMFS
jgi:hypothetical protein